MQFWCAEKTENLRCINWPDLIYSVLRCAVLCCACLSASESLPDRIAILLPHRDPVPPILRAEVIPPQRVTRIVPQTLLRITALPGARDERRACVISPSLAPARSPSASARIWATPMTFPKTPSPLSPFS